MSDPGKAVFLSYASQDAEAAKRICDALRAAGVEVWFDQNELVGGDAWDAKIRKQIKECALFVPLISPATNARAEGYFRREWKQAVERTHDMADDMPFLFPIVLGDITDATARVPDKFREVQWTRLKLEETPDGLAARIAKLLAGDVGPVSDRPHVRATETGPSKAAPPRWQWWMIFPIVGTIMGLMFAALPRWKAFQHSPQTAAAPPPASAVTESAAPAAASPRDWPKNPELKKAVALLDGLQAIPEDIRLAEEIVQPLLEKNPTDAETVTVMARVQSMWLLRGWDRSAARYQKARAVGERALQLAPDEPEALQAMAIYLYTRGSENQRALDLAQRAVDLAPQTARFYRQRDNCLFVLNFSPGDSLTDQAVARRDEEVERAMASARRTAALFPGDPLVHYELARHFRDLGRWEEFEKATDAALALAPVANAIVWKARARLGLHGDLAGMKALLDQVPARVRSIERTVFSYFLYSAYTGDTRDGRDALNGLTDAWMVDFDYSGPKALPLAVLLELDGKKELARLQYETALAELQRFRAANPADVRGYLIEAWSQHGLGHQEEARAALRVYNESILRPFTLSPIGTWWFQPIAANLVMGERETALALIREGVADNPEGRATLRIRFAMDRRLAPFRADPEIKALLAEPAAGGQATEDRAQKTAKIPGGGK